jgi:hypothetical protein
MLQRDFPALSHRSSSRKKITTKSMCNFHSTYHESFSLHFLNIRNIVSLDNDIVIIRVVYCIIRAKASI